MKKIKFEKGAFGAHDFIHCCGKKIKKTLMDFKIPNTSRSIELNVFKCPKCGKEHLDFAEARKLDKYLMRGK